MRESKQRAGRILLSKAGDIFRKGYRGHISRSMVGIIEFVAKMLVFWAAFEFIPRARNRSITYRKQNRHTPAVGLTAKSDGLAGGGGVTSPSIEDVMHRNFIFALAALLVAVAPVWSYSREWTFGPAIAVLFLLGVNLMVYLFAQAEPAETALTRPSAKS